MTDFEVLEDEIYCLREDFDKLKNDTTKEINYLKQNSGNQDIGTLYTLEHDLEVKVHNIENTVKEMKSIVDYMNTVFRIEDTVPFAIVDNKVISLPARCVKAAQFWLDENKAKPQEMKLEMLKDHFGAETFDMKEEI